MPMLSLGKFKFEVSVAAYARLDRLGVYRWEEQARIGRLPANQFVGPGLQTIDLDGTIYSTFAGGIDQVAKMRAIAGKGEPLLIVDGVGRTWGRWVILEARETGTVFFDDGVPRKIDFSLRLAQYGEDGGEDNPEREGEDATDAFEDEFEGDPAGEVEGASGTTGAADAPFDPAGAFGSDTAAGETVGSDLSLSGAGISGEAFTPRNVATAVDLFGTILRAAGSSGAGDLYGPGGRGGNLASATGGRGDIFRA